MEQWKEFLEGYEISSYGRVRSQRKVLSARPNKDGYLQVTIKRNTYKIHRLVAMAFIDNPENKREVNHKDTDKTNNHVSNLEWNTRSENVLHAYSTGARQPNQSKLDKAQILELVKQGHSNAEISRIIGVHKTTIGRFLKKLE